MKKNGEKINRKEDKETGNAKGLQGRARQRERELLDNRKEIKFRQTDKQTSRKERQMNGQIDRQRAREIDGWMDRLTEECME